MLDSLSRIDSAPLRETVETLSENMWNLAEELRNSGVADRFADGATRSIAKGSDPTLPEATSFTVPELAPSEPVASSAEVPVPVESEALQPLESAPSAASLSEAPAQPVPLGRLVPPGLTVGLGNPANWSDATALGYLAQNPDLIYHFGLSGPEAMNAARWHAATYGINEGRQLFDYPSYLQARPDVENHYRRAFPSIPYNSANELQFVQNVMNHYLYFGRFEAVGITPPTMWTDAQAAAYLAAYPDLVAGYGAGNFEAARNHFLQYGFYEGRAVA